VYNDAFNIIWGIIYNLLIKIYLKNELFKGEILSVKKKIKKIKRSKEYLKRY